MDTDTIAVIAPYPIMLIGWLIQNKIFMTPADFQKERASFIQWISEHYVNDKTYRENHKELQEDMRDIRKDLAEIKNLLIERN